MTDPHPFDLVRGFADAVERDASVARTHADLGDDNLLSIIGQRHAPDDGLLREVRVDDPFLGDRVDRLVRHRWAREATVRADLHNCEVVAQTGTVSLADGLERISATTADERRAFEVAVDRALTPLVGRLSVFAVDDAVPEPSLAKSPGGIVLLHAAPNKTAAAATLPAWQPIAECVGALAATVGGAPVHVARRGAAIADFRIHEASGGSWRTSEDLLTQYRFRQPFTPLSWRGALVPIARPGARVAATGPADRTVAAVVASAPRWAIGVARVLAALPPTCVGGLLRDPPTRRIEAGRTLGLALLSAILDDVLAVHAAGNSETLEAMAHGALPDGTDVEGMRAQVFARRYAAARLPGERGLYDFGGGAWLDAARHGVAIASRLRERFDEDWYRNPRLTLEVMMAESEAVEPAELQELLDFVREENRL